MSTPANNTPTTTTTTPAATTTTSIATTTTPQNTPTTTSNPTANTSTTTTAAPPATTSIVTASTTIPTSTAIITSVVTEPPPTQQTSASSQTPSSSRSNTSTTRTSSSRAGTSSTAGVIQASNSGGGLKPGGVIAIAVVIPIVVVAALIVLGIFLWRRRSRKKNDEEDRRKEMEAYGYNPNDDPSLRPIGTLKDDAMVGDGGGYRGWGAAGAMSSAGRKTSTNASSVPGDYNGGAAWNGPSSPTHPYATELPTDAPQSLHHRNGTMDSDVLGAGVGGGLAAGGAGAAAGGLARHPSNASSTYSAGERERMSQDLGGAYNDPHYQDDNAYYPHGPYDTPYGGQQGGGQPIMRDSPARRLTQINEAGGHPQQGGISQNF